MNRPAVLGGARVREKAFSGRRTIGPEEKAAVLEVLDSDVISGFLGGPGPHFLGGPKVQEFERQWAEFFQARHAISVNSWTSGLITCVGAVGVEPGDEIICSPYTMSASATCAFFYGGIPVFADIDPDTFCLDPESIRSRLSSRTRAIIVVHLFGRSAAMEEILEIARPRGIRVIEDAAQAPGATYQGRMIGALGDIGGFSLNFHKHIHTGEGGVIVTNSDELALRAQLIRNHGENAIDDERFTNVENLIGGNSRLTEIQAAIGMAQLRKLNGYLTTRRELARYLDGRLASLDGIAVSPPPQDSLHSYYVYAFRYDERLTGLSRHAFVQAVSAELPSAEGFECTPLVEGYVRPLYLARIYQERSALGGGFPFSLAPAGSISYEKGLCPVTERLYEKELVLSPIVREPHTVTDMADLADAIEKVLAHATEIAASLGSQPDEVYTPMDASNARRVR